MTKQEEIKRGMRKIVEFCGNEPGICVGELGRYLSKMGCVLRFGDDKSGWVEPLIEGTDIEI